MIMANLAIRGHNTRGKEVIEILEMLGGNNRKNCWGVFETRLYLINAFGDIEDRNLNDDSNYHLYTIEEFIKQFPYKVGDKVNYVKYNDEYPSVHTIQRMRWTGTTIEYLLDSSDFSALTKDLQPYKEQEIMKDNSILNQLIEYFNNTPRDVIEKEWHEYDKYNEIGPTVKEYLEYIGKPKYPKDFEECCYILEANVDAYFDHEGDNPYSNDYEFGLEKKLLCLRKLLICRGVYWKLAGEQMGLDKPWEPDWSNSTEIKYCITTIEHTVEYFESRTVNIILAFPTEEMRDAFDENFKNIIEQCKELL